MGIQLTALHWVYVLFIILVMGFMIKRRDTSFICVVGIFILGLIATSSIFQSVMGVFNSFIYAISELLGTILIISIIVAMSKVLAATGVNEKMVAPFTGLIRTPALAYWVIGILMMVISWFFWPSPAVALMGAVLLPVAVRVGLPALGVAMAMNLFGHGIALSGDFIIQGAPKLTADAAGIPVHDVIAASVPLVIVMGIVTTVVAFWLLRRDMQRGHLQVEGEEYFNRLENKEGEAVVNSLSSRMKTGLAVLIPVLFFTDVLIMFKANLQGGDATALIGGTCVFILILITLLAHRNEGLEKITSYLIEGFQFGFRVFGPVIPIAAFFYLGDAGFISIFGDLLPTGSQGVVNDLGVALAQSVPLNAAVGAVTLTTVGAITGLDGSGFSGISLAGSVAHLFSVAIGSGIATLTALGQIAAIWVGGGTLVPWALIPAAAICGVDPFELARRNLVPVVIGLIVTTIVAMFLI
ncbi:MAG: membrane protein [Peptococcaceae bacterium BICA1-8]|nr:MAG: membrane protein [Peptococcaceae bacterium BICA1-8]